MTITIGTSWFLVGGCVLFMFLSWIVTKKKLSPKFENEKLALIANHLYQIRGRSLETMTVGGKPLLNLNNRTMHEASDENDTVVPAETCFSDSKEKASDSDCVSVNESDSDT